MPTITIEGPRIAHLDTRRVLVRELSEAAEKAFEIPIEKIVVLIKENPPENVGVGGELLVDRLKRLAEPPG
jgi:4-oxalocrotonate tautomerase